ncbi:MAG: DUF4232 domain-containing protein [Solirubrobacteraceae bacterium]
MSAALSPGWERARLVLLAVLVGAASAAAGLGLRQAGSRPAALASPAPVLSSIPAAARAPVSAALGADDPAYRVRTSRGLIWAFNPAQGLRASFTRGGVTVRAGASRLSLELTAAGYGATLRPLGQASPRAVANRVRYVHRALTEWYANGPAGLEQGFTLTRALGNASGPSRAGGASGAAPLTLAVRIAGDLRPSLGAGAHGLVLATLTGRAVLSYTGLLASDRRGRTLAAWLSLGNGVLLIHVDAAGARYPVRIDPVLGQIAELTAADGAAGDHFGGGGGIAGPGEDNAVAVSSSTIVVGAPDHRAGAVYVFSKPGGGWQDATQTAELTASDGAAGGELGNAVAISGSTIVAGAPGYSNSAGAVYVFTEPPSGWRNATQTAELTAPDSDCGASGCLVGSSVAISGSTVVAGAPGAGSANDGFGRAYVFSEPASGWQNASSPTAALSGPDSCNGDEFGYSVAISGSTVVAGAPNHVVTCAGNGPQGEAYVFTQPAGGWQSTSQAAVLTASDEASGDQFGWSVAIDGATVVVGSPFHAVGANSQQGAVYEFTQPATGWQSATQTAELTASDGSANDDLGWSVAVNGPTIVAGAPFHLVPGDNSTGAVYAYDEPPSGWRNSTQTAELTRTGGADTDELGKAVAGGGVYEIVAGAPFRIVHGQAQRGAAYVFGAAAAGRPAPTCAAAHLRLSSVRILGAAGHRIWDLALRNAGRVTCELRGYPTVRLLDRRGRPTVSSLHAAGFAVTTVRLARGARAFFTVNYAAAGPCLPHFFSAFGVDVFPPGSRTGLRLRRAAFTLCSVGLGGPPRVTPVRASLNAP